MLSLEQVMMLESKVTRIINHTKKLNEENSNLKKTLDSYQKKIEELEVIVQQFKEDQGRIEDGILSALDRLNKFEDALESKLSSESKLSIESALPIDSALAGGSADSTNTNNSETPITGKELDIF